MARIRTVKPELFRHEDLFELEIETGLPIRIAFAGLFTCADREGRFNWRPRQLKLDVLPYDELDFSRVLDALATRGFIVKYEVEGELYGCLPTFSKHQVINNRERDSELPVFSESSIISDTSTREAREDHAIPIPLSPAQEEGKGREGNKEGKGTRNYASESREIFEFWQSTMNKPRSTFTKNRQAAVTKMLKENYTVDDIKEAIEGCAHSPHHMGKNDTGTVYDDLELICRNGSKLENFRDNVGKVIVETLNEKNLRVAKEFANE